MSPAQLPGLRIENVEVQVTDLVEKMIGRPINEEQPIMEAGLDSLGAVELRSNLQTKFSLDLPATLTFDYPNIASLAKFLGSQLSAVKPQDIPQKVLCIFAVSILNLGFLSGNAFQSLSKRY